MAERNALALKEGKPVELETAFIICIPKGGGAAFASPLDDKDNLIARRASMSDIVGACACVMKDAQAIEFAARFGEIWKASQMMSKIDLGGMSEEERVKFLQEKLGGATK